VTRLFLTFAFASLLAVVLPFSSTMIQKVRVRVRVRVSYRVRVRVS